MQLYDTTLRDGSQGEGISFTVEDKLTITQLLDDLGVHFIEGGWPGANPKDAQYFERMQDVPLSQSTLVAFTNTSRADVRPSDDPSIVSALTASTDVVTIVGKSWDLHVEHVLRTTADENLRMISDTVLFLRSKGRRIFYDAEHFFDGLKNNTDYAMKTIEAAIDAGAEVVVLCDTNGGSMPWEVENIVRRVVNSTSVPVGIHAHNDCELAVSNTLAAVQAGAIQVQGTVNGYGERTGNANLCSIIPNLKLKMGIECINDRQLTLMTDLSKVVKGLAKLSPSFSHSAYVGHSAFAHKGGIHADATRKLSESYQHINPSKVGNQSRILVSELSGRANVMFKIDEFGQREWLREGDERRIAQLVKELESKGFSFESADASLELLIRKQLNNYESPFDLVNWSVAVSPEERGDPLTLAKIKLLVQGDNLNITATGQDSLHALDASLRKGLLLAYPKLANAQLVRYELQLLDADTQYAFAARAFIVSTDGDRTWRTVGCSNSIVDATKQALVDSFEYAILSSSTTDE